MELDFDEALALGYRLVELGQRDDAHALAQRLVEAAPRQPDALHLLGMLERIRGQAPRAIELLTTAHELAPGDAGILNNLGNLLFEADRHAEAEAAYRSVLAIDADRPDVCNNLGVLYRAMRRPVDAEAAYKRALELAPGFADAHHNLGNLYEDLGRIDEAVQRFLQALVVKPRHEQSRRMLGISYSILGRLDEAAAVYRQWLADEPDNPVPRHHLAACTGQAVPERADDAYVQALFDGFASSFDAKLAFLQYRAPELVAQAIARRLAPAGALRVLDAGCGTGLCGPLLKPYAARLVGVDLSAQMLERARAHPEYDELVQGELTAYLAAHPGAYDLVASADTLCYFGELRGVCAAAAGALAPGGCFVFTVESHEEPVPARLRPHGRYSHHRDHVEAALAAAGFEAAELQAVVLRSEAGTPVQGWLASGVRRG